MSTSRLSATKLDALLTQYGASTVGSTERKRERLQRFIDARLDRHIARNAETGEPAPKQLRRSARLASNVAPSPSSAPALSPVRRPATPTLPSQNRMTTRSMAQAMSPTPSPVRRRSHPMVTRSQNPRSAARVALERIRDILSAYLA